MKNQITEKMKNKISVVQQIEVDNKLINKLNQKIERLSKQLDKVKADKAEDLEMLDFLMKENERLMLYVNEALSLDSQSAIKRVLRQAIRVYSQLPDASEFDRALYRVEDI